MRIGEQEKQQIKQMAQAHVDDYEQTYGKVSVRTAEYLLHRRMEHLTCLFVQAHDQERRDAREAKRVESIARCYLRMRGEL